MTNESELSEREREIICLVATGASNKEIAQRLFISTNTVKVHLRNIFAKIGVTSRTEATLFAIREGLVPTPGNLPPQAAVEGEIKGSPVVENGTGVRPPQRRARMIALLSVAALVFLAMVGVTVRQLVTPPQTPAAQTPVPRWQERAPLPAPRSGLAAAVYAGQIYAIGGEDEKQVSGDTYRYSPQSDDWETLAKKPTAVADVAAAVIGGKIYVPGGRLDSGQMTDVLEIYNPRSDQWEPGPHVPIKVSGYGLAAFEGKLYLFGGWDGEQYLPTVYEYEPEQKQWTQKTDMSVPRAYLGVAVAGEEIFVIGGLNNQKVLATNEAYYPARDNPQDHPWEMHSPLPGGRFGMGVTILADHIYLMGGESSRQVSATNNPGLTLQYSPQNDLWQATEFYDGQGVSGLALVATDSFLFSLGGKVQGQPVNRNLSFRAIYTIMIPLVPDK